MLLLEFQFQVLESKVFHSFFHLLCTLSNNPNNFIILIYLSIFPNQSIHKLKPSYSNSYQFNQNISNNSITAIIQLDIIQSAMDKKPNKLTFKDKIKILFCARNPEPRDNQPVVYRKSAERRPPTIKKQQRQTLNINDVFLKLSRKNIVEEEFFSNEVLNLQLQKHIASRIKSCAIGLIKGEFTEQSTQTLKIAIYLSEKPAKTIPYRQQIKSDPFIKIRKDFIDLVLYQTTQTCSSSQTKKPKPKNQQISTDYGVQINVDPDKRVVEEQFNEILKVLSTHAGLVDNIVIICSRHIDLLDYNKQLMEFSQEYLFELERVRENQELVCNIIYISRNAAFLKLSDKAFKEFIVGEMQLSIQEEGRMSDILTKLMAEKYYREIVNTVRVLKKQKFTTRSLFQPFIVKISSENQKIRKTIAEMKNLVFIEESIQHTPELVEPTPMFFNVKSSMFKESQC